MHGLVWSEFSHAWLGAYHAWLRAKGGLRAPPRRWALGARAGPVAARGSPLPEVARPARTRRPAVSRSERPTARPSLLRQHPRSLRRTRCARHAVLRGFSSGRGAGIQSSARAVGLAVARQHVGPGAAFGSWRGVGLIARVFSHAWLDDRARLPSAVRGWASRIFSHAWLGNAP